MADSPFDLSSDDEPSLEEVLQKEKMDRVVAQLPDPMSLLPTWNAPVKSIAEGSPEKESGSLSNSSSNPRERSGSIDPQYGRDRRDSRSRRSFERDRVGMERGEEEYAGDLISISDEGPEDDSMEMELKDVAVNTSNEFFTSLALTPAWNNLLQWTIVLVAIVTLGMLCGAIAFTFELNTKVGPFVILVSIDGFRADYLESSHVPHLQELAKTGVRAKFMVPVFPSLTFPNHWSLITGLTTESTGIIANEMYDPVLNETYSLYTGANIRNGAWYGGEPFWATVQKAGWKSGTYFWPGSEAVINGYSPTLSARYNKSLSSSERVDGLLNWFENLPEGLLPSFYTLYFDSVDTQGHLYGPGSIEVNNALADVDAAIAKLTHGLSRLGFMEKTNIILVSDHGMTQLSPSKIIFLDELIEMTKLKFVVMGPTTFIIPADEKQLNEIYNNCSKDTRLDVYKKDMLPESFFLKHNVRTTPLVLVAHIGYSITTTTEYNQHHERFIGGNHGYLSTEPDMRAIFIANGPLFKKGFESEPINVTDVYAVLCAIYGIPGAPNNGSRTVTKDYFIK